MVNKEYIDYDSLFVICVIDVFIGAHSGVLPFANELTTQNIVLIKIQLNPIPPIAMSAYLIHFNPSLYLLSSPAAVNIMNPWYMRYIRATKLNKLNA